MLKIQILQIADNVKFYSLYLLVRSNHFQLLLLELLVIKLRHLNNKLFLEISALEISTVLPLLSKINI